MYFSVLNWFFIFIFKPHEKKKQIVLELFNESSVFISGVLIFNMTEIISSDYTFSRPEYKIKCG